MTTAAILAPLLAAPGRTGIFSDFDGTLSPIVDDPAAARPLDGARGVLATLAARFGVVGVISGRPAAFLLDQLGDGGLLLWGLHGLETVQDGRVVPVPAAVPWEPVVEAAAGRAEHELAGVSDVERKVLALTVHFRRAPVNAGIVREWAERVAADTGLAVHPARMSYELRPPVPHGKGLVLEHAALDAGLSAACFFGDDAGDVDAFTALDRLGAAGVSAVRVAVRSEESPRELLDRADAVVDGPEGVLDVLRALAENV